MIRKTFITLLLSFSYVVSAHALWVWTPENGKFVNPKHAVKETPKAQLDFAVDYYNSRDYKKASDELEKLIRNYPRAREAADAQYYLARILEDQGQLFAAHKSYQIVIEKYPFSDRAAEVVKRQYEIANMMLEGKGRRGKFVNAVVGGDYDVVEVFRAVIKNAPYGEFAAPSQYKIGLYLLQKNLYQEARDEFEKTRNDYPDSEWSKAAKFQIALSDAKRSSPAQYNQKITASALKEFEDFLKKFPDADLSSEAKKHINSLREKEAENNYLIAQFYIKQKQYEPAKIYYKTIVEKYSETTWARRALRALRRLEKL